LKGGGEERGKGARGGASRGVGLSGKTGGGGGGRWLGVAGLGGREEGGVVEGGRAGPWWGGANPAGCDGWNTRSCKRNYACKSPRQNREHAIGGHVVEVTRKTDRRSARERDGLKRASNGGSIKRVTPGNEMGTRRAH